MAFLVAAALSAIAGIPASASAAPPTATTEAATGVNYEQATLEGMVDPEGSPTSYWFEYGKTESYGAKIPVSPESVGSGTSNVAVSQTVTGLSQSTTYHFRVVAESEAGTTKGEDGFLKTAGFEFAFGEEGPSNGQFKQPNLGIATDSEGNIWVTDTENNRVEEFNSKGEYLSQFGKEGAGNGEFNSPKGLAIDSSDNIWVVDSGNNRVQEFNSKGEYLLKFGEKGSGNGQFNSPSGIAFDPSARLWVTDTGNNRIQRFNASTFNYISQFGKKGTGNGEFNNPTGLASDFQERLWVVDSGNNRAQKFSVTTEHAGEYLDQVGKEGTGPGQFIEPTGIVAPAAQKLLILDTGNDRVQKWTVKAEAPTANTNVASNLKTTSVTLNARINPEAFATNYWFEYGLTEIYGAKVPLTPEPIGSGTSNVLVEQTVTGLSEGTKYHFRVVAKSAAGTSFGNDRTVKTCKPAPAATTEAATAIGSTQATLNGKVNPEGCTTTYWFEYGTTEAYGTKIPLIPASVGSGISSVAVSQTPAGLSKGTEYHFRVVTENAAGTSKGTDKTFTTSP